MCKHGHGAAYEPCLKCENDELESALAEAKATLTDFDRRLCFALGMKTVEPEEALNVIDGMKEELEALRGARGGGG